MYKTQVTLWFASIILFPALLFLHLSKLPVVVPKVEISSRNNGAFVQKIPSLPTPLPLPERKRKLKIEYPFSPILNDKETEILFLVKKLENSSTTAISNKGAVGIFQILPSTAKFYGYDPNRLKDPIYNEIVAKAIIINLFNRFDGNIKAILIAYNAGPKYTQIWLKRNKKIYCLPKETRKYLTKAVKFEIAFEGN